VDLDHAVGRRRWDVREALPADALRQVGAILDRVAVAGDGAETQGGSCAGPADGIDPEIAMTVMRIGAGQEVSEVGEAIVIGTAEATPYLVRKLARAGALVAGSKPTTSRKPLAGSETFAGKV